MAVAVSRTEALKFSREGVTFPESVSESGVLPVDSATELGCRYITWQQERLHSVTWSVQYSGVKTNFFIYQANGEKEVVPGVSLIIVDPNNSSNKTVAIRLTDGREESVSFCCHVKVLRDDGYGSMTRKEKEKCSEPVRVEGEVRRPGNLVSASLDAPDSGRVGQTVSLVCQGNQLTQYHRMKLVVNGAEVVVRDTRSQRLEYALNLQSQHFAGSGGYSYGPQVEEVTVGCLVMQGYNVVANTTRTIRKEDSYSRPPGPQTYPRPTSTGISRGGRQVGSFHEHRTHPESVPCHSYLLLEQTRRGSMLRGRLSSDVLEEIESPTPIGTDRHETPMSPEKLLDLLGFLGHRVVGMAANSDGIGMVWTLERKYYEFHDEL